MSAAQRTGCPVADAFEAVADAAAGNPAVILPDHTESYGELDGRANAVAHLLLDRPGEPIALMVADPLLMIAAQLGALKAGRPYCVVNPHFPEARRSALIELLGATQVVTDGTAPAPDGVYELPVSRSDRPAGRPPAKSGPDEPAYILFTSGSTGEPRGIAHARADMRHNVERHAPFGIGPADRVTLISADGVISAVSNLYIALLSGASVVPYSFRGDGVHDLLDWIGRSGITVFYAFPSFLRQSAAVAPETAAAPRVRLAYLGGEPVTAADFAQLGRLFPEAVRASGLNSTETGLTRVYTLPAKQPPPARIPLGGPVADVEVAFGENDRILVRSPHIRPVLWTADGPRELFRPVDADGALFEFATGDRGEYDAAGRLVHLGRADAMVKIRGYRVEPSEVEAALRALPGVTEAGVLARPDEHGQLELAAVVSASGPAITEAHLRRRAAAVLPSAMVPSTVVLRDTLPRTANGKLDRTALAALLPAPGAAGSDRADGAEAAGADTMQRLLAIWRAVLRLDAIGAQDDFFELGGTSISALSVISRVRKEFGVPVRLAVLFETPTLAALTAAVETARNQE